MFLKIFQILQENTRPLGLQLYLKETPTLVFSCEIYNIFKNTYSEEQLQRTAFKGFQEHYQIPMTKNIQTRKRRRCKFHYLVKNLLAFSVNNLSQK